jgi:hypothetical protein
MRLVFAGASPGGEIAMGDRSLVVAVVGFAVLFAAGLARAEETLCVDSIDRPGKPSEWTVAEHLGETTWTEQGSDTLRLFVFRPQRDEKELWETGIELGVFWEHPPALLDGVSDAVLDQLRPLQFVTASFTPATKEASGQITFDRVLVKLTDAGDFRKDLNQTWRYELRPSDDCQELTGHITMFRGNETPATGMKMPVTLTRVD